MLAQKEMNVPLNYAVYLLTVQENKNTWRPVDARQGAWLCNFEVHLKDFAARRG
jgi:hypothetical protein